MKLLLIFSTFFLLTVGQKLISLNSFGGDNKRNELNATGPFSVYLSANSDDDNILKQINLVSGVDKISLFDLKNRKVFANNITQLQPFQVLESAYVMTSLNRADIYGLTGVLFVSTAAQMKDESFFVVDIADAQTIYSTNNPRKLTILFLNTNTVDTPKHSTMISNWSQYSQDIFLYEGVPSDSPDQDYKQIFSNPVITPHGWDLHDVVETFSVQLVAFYMKAFTTSNVMNVISLKVEPGYVNIQGTSTSALSTTGFYMKPYREQDKNITVAVKSHDNYYGYIGANILGLVSRGAKVGFDVYVDKEDYGTSVVPSEFFTPWSTPQTKGNMVISSRGTQNGQFYVQYYVSQISIDTFPETTTKSAGKLFSMMIFLVPFLSFVNNLQ